MPRSPHAHISKQSQALLEVSIGWKEGALLNTPTHTAGRHGAGDTISRGLPGSFFHFKQHIFFPRQPMPIPNVAIS